MRAPFSNALELKIKKVGETFTVAVELLGDWSFPVVRLKGWTGLCSLPPLTDPLRLRYFSQPMSVFKKGLKLKKAEEVLAVVVVRERPPWTVEDAQESTP